MKRSLLFFALAFSPAMFAQNVNIPDVNFKTYLITHPGINTNGDSEIQVTEASSFADSIIADGMGIQDMTGIEAFTNLVFLSVVNNSLNSIDVTQNTQLTELICAMNNLTTLNVSQNVLLERLVISLNTGLAAIDLSANVNLKEIHLENTSISTIDLSHQSALELGYFSNSDLTSLDVSFCPNIKGIQCAGNMISNLNTSGCTELESIYAHGNALSSMNLSTNVGLKWLRVCCNLLTTLDLSTLVNLEYLDCPFNNLTTIDLSNNPNLKSIYLFGNELTSLNAANGNNTNIELFWAQDNDLQCVTVDSPTYSSSNWQPTSNSFSFDPTVIFSTDCASLGMAENELMEMKMFPNPVSNAVFIEISEKAKWSLFTISGELILEQEMEAGGETIDLSQLPSGIYMVKVTKNGATGNMEKLVKL